MMSFRPNLMELTRPYPLESKGGGIETVEVFHLFFVSPLLSPALSCLSFQICLGENYEQFSLVHVSNILVNVFCM